MRATKIDTRIRYIPGEPLFVLMYGSCAPFRMILCTEVVGMIAASRDITKKESH